MQSTDTRAAHKDSSLNIPPLLPFAVHSVGEIPAALLESIRKRYAPVQSVPYNTGQDPSHRGDTYHETEESHPPADSPDPLWCDCSIKSPHRCSAARDSVVSVHPSHCCSAHCKTADGFCAADSTGFLSAAPYPVKQADRVQSMHLFPVPAKTVLPSPPVPVKPHS